MWTYPRVMSLRHMWENVAFLSFQGDVFCWPALSASRGWCLSPSHPLPCPPPPSLPYKTVNISHWHFLAQIGDPGCLLREPMATAGGFPRKPQSLCLLHMSEDGGPIAWPLCLWGQAVFGDGRETRRWPFPCGTWAAHRVLSAHGVAWAMALPQPCFGLSSGSLIWGTCQCSCLTTMSYLQEELCWRNCSASRRTGLQKKQRSSACRSLPWGSSFLSVTASGNCAGRTPSPAQFRLM